jgi:hypothetical protein
VRTYWAHGTHGDGALLRLLHSLRAQTHTQWRALLLVLDSRPFPDLHHIVADLADPRVEVFAEWIAARYSARALPAPAAAGGAGAAAAPAPTSEPGWAPSYHDALYNATDAAVRACPRETEWLAVTNGDNEYDPAFLRAAVALGSSSSGGGGGEGASGGGSGGGKQQQHQQPFDIVAADYYTRYLRPTGPPCDRFSNETVEAVQAAEEARRLRESGGAAAAAKAAPATKAPPAPLPGPCKPNLLRWCQTDLAATVYYWPRFVEEDVRFWDASLPGDAAGSHDGRLAEALASSGLASLRRRKLAATAAKAAKEAGASEADVAAASAAAAHAYVPTVPSESRPWRAARLFPGERCLVDHNPTPRRCALEGGVWDDSRRATQGVTGGKCLERGEAALMLAQDGGGAGGGRLELVEVDLAHDSQSFGGAAALPPPLRCIRLRDRREWPREAAFFGPKCNAEQEGGVGWTYG